jgi:hypothetical protein
VSTPEENAEIAVDESKDPSAREEAIDDLRAANECSRLTDIALNDDIDDRYREQAVTNLAHPQCKPALRALVERSELPESMQNRAEELLDDTPDRAGTGTGAGTE